MSTPVHSEDVASLTRIINGAEVPAAGVWALDPGHAEVGFVGRHFMLTKVRGRFRGVNATIHIADKIEDSVVTATIDMATIDTGDDARDDHLRSSDLFEVAAHPTGTFRSTKIVNDGRKAQMTGDLTLKDTTKRVTLDVEFLGAVTDPWGNQRVVFDAAGRINREDWGITWNMPLDGGGFIVSKDIDLTLHIEAIRQ